MARSAAPSHLSGGTSTRNPWSPAGGGVHSPGLGEHHRTGGFSTSVRHDALNHYGDAHRDFDRFSYAPYHNVYSSHWIGYRPHYAHYPHYAFVGFGLGFYGSYWPGYYPYDYSYSYAYPAAYTTYPASYSDSAAYPPTYYYEEPTTNNYATSTNDFSGTVSPQNQNQRPGELVPEDGMIPRALIPSGEAPESLPEENSTQPDTNKSPAVPSPQNTPKSA